MRPPYASWNRSWLTWLYTNALGAAGSLLLAQTHHESVGFAGMLCGFVLLGSTGLLPIIRLLMARVLAPARLGSRLLWLAGAVGSCYMAICFVIIGLGGFFGLIWVLTGLPYLPATLAGAALAFRRPLLR